MEKRAGDGSDWGRNEEEVFDGVLLGETETKRMRHAWVARKAVGVGGQSGRAAWVCGGCTRRGSEHQ